MYGQEWIWFLDGCGGSGARSLVELVLRVPVGSELSKRKSYPVSYQIDLEILARKGER